MCKSYTMQRDVQPQCVTYGEEIPTGNPDNVSTDLWVRGKFGNFLCFEINGNVVL